MRWRERVEPVRMQRVAVVAPTAALRDVLVGVAAAGTVEVDRATAEGGEQVGEQATALRESRAQRPDPVLSTGPPDLDAWEEEQRFDLIEGEAALDSVAAAAVVRDEVAALAGWTAAADVAPLAERLAPAGGAVVTLPSPRGLDPPTKMRPGGAVKRSFSPLVRTYATVPYSDVDPTLLAGAAYVLMFGMMFGDVGHGALVVLAALLIRLGRPSRLARFRQVWPFIAMSGVAAMVFGLLYGEFFGPTGVIPVLWISPLEEPVTLLTAALGVGAVLLGGAYAVGTVNRWREGGFAVALSAASGIAGASLYVGLGLVSFGALEDVGWLVAVGGIVAAAGLALSFVGFLAAVPADADEGWGSRLGQAGVEVFDSTVRLATSLVSFARLAAFGLTHAAVSLVVWDGTTSLWNRGGPAVVAAVLVFVVGNALAFALEALVAAVQALRLEYYELFSRVFTLTGRPFRPWQLPVDAGPDTPAPDGAPGAVVTERRTP
jgi:V/A-type H+-transporting ATPase subunit I